MDFRLPTIFSFVFREPGPLQPNQTPCTPSSLALPHHCPNRSVIGLFFFHVSLVYGRLEVAPTLPRFSPTPSRPHKHPPGPRVPLVILSSDPCKLVCPPLCLTFLNALQFLWNFSFVLAGFFPLGRFSWQSLSAF